MGDDETNENQDLNRTLEPLDKGRPSVETQTIGTGVSSVAQPYPHAILSIALSGGGYRAALFHLGAMRRLNELKVLPKLGAVSSVSGGSLLAALLAKVRRNCGGWPSPEQWIAQVETPMIDFVRRDIRTVPAIVSWAWFVILLVAQVFVFAAAFLHFPPWTVALTVTALCATSLGLWFTRGYGPKLLARSYLALNSENLKDLENYNPSAVVEFIFCATNVVFGVGWTMRRDVLGDYLLGKAETPSEFKIASAVAASSCFPPVFFPTRMKPQNLDYAGGKYLPAGERKAWASKIDLTDGGVYDNLGTEPLWKDGKYDLLVSDGGGPLPVVSEKLVLPLIQRYTAIIQNQAIALRKRMLIDKIRNKQLAGTYWGLFSVVDSYRKDAAGISAFDSNSLSGYSPDFVKNWISPIRTDLAYFSPEEVGILMNHGYSLADAAILVHRPDLAENAVPFAWPFARLTAEKEATIFLKASHRLISFSRLMKSWESAQSYLAKLDSYR